MVHCQSFSQYRARNLISHKFPGEATLLSYTIKHKKQDSENSEKGKTYAGRKKASEDYSLRAEWDISVSCF